MMRVLLGCTLVLAFCSGLSADDKKFDAKLLIGKWEPKEKGAGRTVLLSLAKGGEALFTFTEGDNVSVGAGTYALDGAKLTLTMTVDDIQKLYWERAVTKLTDDELVTKDDKGTERTFVRVKDKK